MPDFPIPALLLLAVIQARPGTPDGTLPSSAPAGQAARKDGAATRPSPPAQRGQGSDRKGLPGWIAWKRAVETRLRKDLRKLRALLESRYMADLGLSYAENRTFLERRFREIRKLDPEIPALCLDLLAAPRPSRVHRNRAENIRRILDGLDLEPFRDRLEALAASPRIEIAADALFLLSRLPGTELRPGLTKGLRDSPPSVLPLLLAAAGRTGDHRLVPVLLPFLERRQARTVEAAARALSRLGAFEDLPALLGAARTHPFPAVQAALLELLLRLCGDGALPSGEALSPAVETALYLSDQEDLLSRTDFQRLLSKTPDLGRRAAPAGKAALLAKLHELLNRPSVELEAARALLALGDKTGKKTVLNRLNRFIKKNRRIPYGWVQRARAHLAFGMENEALKDLREAIQLSGRGRADPSLYFLAASLEIKRNRPSAVARLLKEADPTPEELARFRKRHPILETWIKRHFQIRRIFEKR